MNIYKIDGKTYVEAESLQEAIDIYAVKVGALPNRVEEFITGVYTSKDKAMDEVQSKIGDADCLTYKDPIKEAARLIHIYYSIKWEKGKSVDSEIVEQHIERAIEQSKKAKP